MKVIMSLRHVFFRTAGFLEDESELQEVLDDLESISNLMSRGNSGISSGKRVFRLILRVEI
jgi:hypothetical protein